ncbi:replication initiator [Actinoalloteichus sp. AHMU CJ021]|uniref:replication initiator n=1 Tax=Actinoalloteichus sp. AHMU CJ021 TaxID=2072503 RepID=UPI00307BD2C0
MGHTRPAGRCHSDLGHPRPHRRAGGQRPGPRLRLRRADRHQDHPVHGLPAGTTITEGKVAGYVAKYATKGTENATGTLDHRLKRISDLWFESVPEHAARMIRTAWALGARDDLKHLNLRKWAHMLGFRGHFSTKTRAYSTTLSALRAARAAWHRRHTSPPSPTTLVLAHWAYDGIRLTPDLERLAALIGGGPTREQDVTTSAW